MGGYGLIGCLLAFAGVLVKELEEGLVGVVVEVVDLVAAGQEVGHGRRRGLVGDGGRDDVDDVAVVILDGDM